jgi:hypothetical protein
MVQRQLNDASAVLPFKRATSSTVEAAMLNCQREAGSTASVCVPLPDLDTFDF